MSGDGAKPKAVKWLKTIENFSFSNFNPRHPKPIAGHPYIIKHGSVLAWGGCFWITGSGQETSQGKNLNLREGSAYEVPVTLMRSPRSVKNEKRR